MSGGRNDGRRPGASSPVDEAGALLSPGLTIDPYGKRALSTRAWGKPASTLRYTWSGRAELLARMGIHTIRDELLAHPSRYLDFTKVTDVLHAQVGSDVTVVANVDRVKVKRPKPRMTIVEVSCYDDTAPLIVTFFGQPWLAESFRPGQLVSFSGKVTLSMGFKKMNSPLFDVLVDVPKAGDSEEAQATAIAMRPQDANAAARMVPVYRVTEGLSCAWARRIAAAAVTDYGDVMDFWPASLRARRKIMSLTRVIRAAHFPRDAEEVEEARRRLAYDEATLLQIALRIGRENLAPGVHPTAHAIEGGRMDALRAAMPFPLTADQAQATAEILADMAAPRSMSRLLLGDVGTGKTAVATHALGAVAQSGTQAAVMAPTGVLAAQYAKKVGPILDSAHISWALLTGATPAAEREGIVRSLARGETCVLFGTHALLSEDVTYRALSLVIIDEQQRFGVRQRRALREKGRGADLLIMTATPIPRTLALSLYGDLDCSYLRERPNPGAGVTTKVIAKRDRGDAYEAIREALEEGHQAYVVCPLIGSPAAKDADEPDVAAEALAQGEDPSDMKAAQTEAEVLQRKVFPEAKVGLLTGRMPPREKQQVMDDFRSGEIQVLVSTTVIEVGVDVPNATVMLIEDGERFGLAQLHQLRGRVGRGQWPGTVYIAASGSSKTARERLQALERTSDGFELAEQDLRIRREGEILGSRQSGDVSLRYVDPSRDMGLLMQARVDAEEMLARDPRLESTELAPVRDELVARYGDVMREVGGG